MLDVVVEEPLRRYGLSALSRHAAAASALLALPASWRSRVAWLSIFVCGLAGPDLFAPSERPISSACPNVVPFLHSGQEQVKKYRARNSEMRTSGCSVMSM